MRCRSVFRLHFEFRKCGHQLEQCCRDYLMAGDLLRSAEVCYTQNANVGDIQLSANTSDTIETQMDVVD